MTEQPLGRDAFLILFLCFCISALEGYDLQVLAVAAPAEACYPVRSVTPSNDGTRVKTEAPWMAGERHARAYALPGAGRVRMKAAQPAKASPAIRSTARAGRALHQNSA